MADSIAIGCNFLLCATLLARVLIMKEPKQYIFEEWDSMCAKANKSLHSACPLLEDEVLVEMHKYVGAILIENDRLLRELKALDLDVPIDSLLNT